MPRDQGDLFGRVPPPRVVTPVERTSAADPDVLTVMGVGMPVDQVEREIDRLHRSVTGPLAYRNTLCVTARELATAAMMVERLKGRAIAVLRAWQAQEMAIGRVKAGSEKR
ncbi:MAG: hypothetical protein NVV72_01135 [Asticcacaulis sp.]|nr:hypothetical protein [Asticcacaulis sp.]